MTYFTENARRIAFPTRFFQGLSHGFGRFLKVLSIAADNDSRLREVARLRAKSDAELSEMGLTRNSIVHHVYRDIFYI